MYANGRRRFALAKMGAWVARWTEKEEQSGSFRGRLPESSSPCGPPNGTCVAPLLTSKMQQYGARLVEAESAAIHQKARAAALARPPAEAGGHERAGRFSYAPSAAPATSKGGVGPDRRLVPLVGVGVAALVTGVSIWAIDSRTSNDMPHHPEQPMSVRRVRHDEQRA